MIRFQQMSINSKLVLALGCVALLAFAVAGVALALVGSITLERRARQVMKPYAQLVSVGAETAVAFEDPGRAREILATLRANPQILGAKIVLRDGRLLADYHSGSSAAFHAFKADGIYLYGNNAELQQNLQDDAHLHLVMSLDELNRQARNILQLFSAGVLVLLVAVSLGLRATLQLIIVRPISTLAETVEQVRILTDYSRRVPVSGDDEVARLGQSFNAMMGAIQAREEEIRTLNQELQLRVIERTAQLEAANKELEAFCYSVSHDLRAPLRHIDGYVELLVSRCRDGLSDKGLHYVDTIADSARQMGVLIDDLLLFSRTGRADMRQERVDMNMAIREVLVTIQESCAGRAIEWVVGELPPVRGDYPLLRQVWANLLGNAVKYTRTRESARIEVSSREGDNETIFMVADNGVGFDMQYAGKLFGVFQRLHSQEEFEGTGIGLATVQRIITRHGGRVWAEAELDKGAKFYFTLPGKAGVEAEG